AAGEARRFRRRSLELVDHLAFGQLDRAERHGEANVFRKELDLDLAEADFAGEGMVAAIAALRRISHGKQEAFIGAGEILQAEIAVGGKVERLAGEIADRRTGFGFW